MNRTSFPDFMDFHRFHRLARGEKIDLREIPKKEPQEPDRESTLRSRQNLLPSARTSHKNTDSVFHCHFRHLFLKDCFFVSFSIRRFR